MKEIIFVVLFLVLWIGTIVYAYKKQREHFWTVFILCLFAGPIGYMISLLIISSPKTENLNESEENVESCPNCGWLYKPEDYRNDVAIVCISCSSTVREPKI